MINIKNWLRLLCKKRGLPTINLSKTSYLLTNWQLLYLFYSLVKFKSWLFIHGSKHGILSLFWQNSSIILDYWERAYPLNVFMLYFK